MHYPGSGTRWGWRCDCAMRCSLEATTDKCTVLFSPGDQEILARGALRTITAEVGETLAVRVGDRVKIGGSPPSPPSLCFVGAQYPDAHLLAGVPSEAVWFAGLASSRGQLLNGSDATVLRRSGATAFFVLPDSSGVARALCTTHLRPGPLRALSLHEFAERWQQAPGRLKTSSGAAPWYYLLTRTHVFSNVQTCIAIQARESAIFLIQ